MRLRPAVHGVPLQPGRAQRGGGGLYVGGATFGVSVGTKIGVKIAAGIGVEGTKREMHDWQHEKILEYKAEHGGQRPPLNKSDW